MSSTTALTHALLLAILAPDQARADRAIALAESIGAGCTPKQIDAAKRKARLIAAAPDLLEALKNAMEHIPTTLQGCAIAAIAKAEGKA